MSCSQARGVFQKHSRESGPIRICCCPVDKLKYDPLVRTHCLQDYHVSHEDYDFRSEDYDIEFENYDFRFKDYDIGSGYYYIHFENFNICLKQGCI